MTAQPPPASPGANNSPDVGDELKHDAEHLKDSVSERAKQEAASRKGQAVQAAGSASSALNAAAEKLQNDPSAPDWMGSAMQQAARKIDSMASQMGGQDIDEILGQITAFARQNPGTFLAASAATGFAAARVLRAGADKKRHDQSGDHNSQYSANHGGSAQDKPSDAAPGYVVAGAQPNAGGVAS